MKTGNNRATATTSVMGRSPFAVPPIYDLIGWKAIAGHLGRSARFCQKVAIREVNSLPVVRLGGNVAASSAALNRWVEQEAAPLPAGVPALRLVTA